jgi:antitoxin HicB
MKYPATFTPADEGGFVVTFRDIPEAITQGDDEAEALDMAADVLLSSMEFYFEDKRQVPPPSKPEAGERLIALPLSVAAKILLLNRMIERNVRAADLARMMGIKPQEVNRLIDLNHSTKIDTLALAMLAMGCELELTFNDNSYALAA